MDIQIKKGVPDRLNFGGIYGHGKVTSATGLTLLLYGYDYEKKKIDNVDGGIILKNDKDEVAAKWHFSKLIEMWNKNMHRQSMYLAKKIIYLIDMDMWLLYAKAQILINFYLL